MSLGNSLPHLLQLNRYSCPGAPQYGHFTVVSKPGRGNFFPQLLQ
jgi:hypothetical protein